MEKQGYGTTGAPPYPQAGAPPYPQSGAPPYPQAGAPPYPQSGAPPYPQAGAPPYPQSGAPTYAPQGHGGPMDKVMSSYPPSAEGSYQGATDQGVEASCPPLEMMDQVPGYNNVGFEGVALPPPSYDEAIGQRPDIEVFRSTGSINAEDAREAILEHARNNCCWGTEPAKTMTINDLVSFNGYHYTLETFAESRSTKWASEPFYGGNIYITGNPPGPWDIAANPPQMFKSSKLDLEVPNTASVKPCHKCQGMGSTRCGFCHGIGRRSCFRCSGSGRRTEFRDGKHETVSCGCMGGQEWCSACNGIGRKQCHKCKGKGNLRWYIQLTVKWTNHLESHVEQRTSLPNELIREVTGEMAFEETYPRVWPISTFPVREINDRSKDFVTLHSTKYTMEKILMQRQRVQTVPITQVLYTHKDKSANYFVFGLEHKVHAPDYPATCCCGCSIL
ncbi:hypothetical protein RRG08_006778 [Elysia crispata]|nr:hypothetical protein RRG08_006778 [Elysia crispata]